MALNSEGIWEYSEADLASLFSDLLNLGMDSVTAQFVVDRAALAALDVRLDTIEAGVRPYRVHVQRVTLTILSGTNTVAGAITFPAGRFTVAPVVQASIDNSSSGAMTAAVASSVTAGTARVTTPANVGANTAIPLLIVATQMTPTTAVG